LAWTARSSDLASLQINDINFAQREIQIFGGKGEKERFVFFTAQTEQALRAYLLILQLTHPALEVDLVFRSAVNRRGNVRKRPITPSGIAQMMADRCDAAGVKRINPHSIRHLFGTKALNEDDIPLEVVSELMGHASQEFTERVYAPLTNKKMKREYEQHWKPS
jgi:integrase